MERLNRFRIANGLGNDFVVLFAGTMGFFQGLDTVIEAARSLTCESELTFLLVGDGVERGKLEHRATGLSNVRFLPMQSRDVYPDVLGACDVALVPLHPDIATATVPSKIMTIMAAGRPMVVCIPARTGEDIRRLLRDAECGIATPAGDAGALASAILRLKQDERLARGLATNGRAYAVRNLARSVCVARIERVLKSVAEGRRCAGPVEMRHFLHANNVRLA